MADIKNDELKVAKRCKTCQTVKVESEFDKNRRVCRACRKAKNSLYYQTNKTTKWHYVKKKDRIPDAPPMTDEERERYKI